MGLYFSGVAGIVQAIDDTVGTNNSTYPIASKTRDINLALDRVFALIFQVGGTWQFDDSNHTNYPILTADLVANQRDYSFTTDSSGNFILDIYKVMIADSNGDFFEVMPVDQQSNPPITMIDGQNTTGQPFFYDKTGNGIFLDPIPNYNATGGIKIFVNRTGSYFTTSDTTKTPGFAAIFHEYLVLRPSYQYAYRKSLDNVNILKAEILEMEAEIQNYYKSRERDVSKTLIGRVNNYK